MEDILTTLRGLSLMGCNYYEGLVQRRWGSPNVIRGANTGPCVKVSPLTYTPTTNTKTILGLGPFFLSPSCHSVPPPTASPHI